MAQHFSTATGVAKKSFPSKKAAQASLKRSKTMVVYKCKLCKQYHVGAPHNTGNRFKKLRRVKRELGK